MKQHSKMSRCNNRQRVMVHANHAANSKDQYEFFKHIRHLSLKTPYKRSILRSADGKLLDPFAAADALADWLRELDVVNPVLAC